MVFVIKRSKNKHSKNKKIDSETYIILDNRKNYFNSISNKPFVTKAYLKVRYIHHINSKKKRLIL
jgi:hypothetical protein